MIQLLIVYFNNLRTNTVEEITVMRYHQQAKVGTAEIFFQPFSHIQIQMVGRLIQNQQVGFGNQGVGQCNTLQLSAGQLLHLLIKISDFQLR